MNDGWIKLHRKLLDNDLISDERSLQIFIWLLLKVDHKTGEKKIAMRWASEELKIPLSTFHGALQRLIKKYKILNAKVNANYTTISFINWFNYQQTERTTEQTPNADRTLPEHLQEERIKNKEIYTSKNSLNPCTKDELIEMARRLQLNQTYVNIKHDEIIEKIEDGSFQKKYPNHKTVYKTLIAWLRRDLKNGEVKNQSSYKIIPNS